MLRTPSTVGTKGEQSKKQAQNLDAEQWIVWPDDKRRLGPFESVELAITVRSYVEAVEKRDDLRIDPGFRS